MNQRVILLIFSLLVAVAYFPVYATEPYCQNLGFESGNFTNWVGYTWIYRTDYPTYSTPKQEGIVSGRQTIMTDTTAYDANTGNKLRKIPKGSRYSARLGDAVIGGLEESLSYTLTVDSTNALLIWRFAVVLQNPLSGHLKYEEPRFKVSLIDQHGDTIPDCANYDVYASDATINGFQTYYKSNNNPIFWRDWTAVGANLLPYLGQTVTIEFMAADCTHQNHFGYAYFVAECHPMYIAMQYCSGDTKAKLIAPEGFEKYVWKDSANVTVGSTRALEVADPKEGSKYNCLLTSATGCTVSLSSKIQRYEPNADFKYELVDCNNLSNTMRFTNIYPAVNGTLEYNWDFGGGKTSTEKNPVFTFNSSGLHDVTLVVSNPPSTCSDSITKRVETFYPPLVGIKGDSLYCAGKTTTLKAYGAYRYEWSNGSTADSIQVGNDTTVWMIGYSSAGCYTEKKYFKVRQAPDWNFSSDGKLIFCSGGSTTLTAAGAMSYRWNTGVKTDTIRVITPGTYTVTGVNSLGCEKVISINVVEDPLPNVDFSLSTPEVDSRRNKLTCTVPFVDGILYEWTMGDGNSKSGPEITHAYDVSNNLYDYTITLTATNGNGCVNSLSKTVDIVPFIPNVFTPNGDGVNDVFVPGMTLQVYDRYGLKLCDGNDGWDGTFNGKKMDNDTYFYHIIYTDKHQQTQIMKGCVTLMR